MRNGRRVCGCWACGCWACVCCGAGCCASTVSAQAHVTMATASPKSWFPGHLHLFAAGGDVISSPPHKLMVGALGHAVPRPHQRLELRVGRVHLPGHGCLLRLFPVDLCGELLEIAEHRHRDLDHLDLHLGLRLEAREGHRVLFMEESAAVDLHGGEGMV